MAASLHETDHLQRDALGREAGKLIRQRTRQ